MILNRTIPTKDRKKKREKRRTYAAVAPKTSTRLALVTSANAAANAADTATSAPSLCASVFSRNSVTVLSSGSSAATTVANTSTARVRRDSSYVHSVGADARPDTTRWKSGSAVAASQWDVGSWGARGWSAPRSGVREGDVQVRRSMLVRGKLPRVGRSSQSARQWMDCGLGGGRWVVRRAWLRRVVSAGRSEGGGGG